MQQKSLEAASAKVQFRAVMRTYKIELRHAPSKNKLNAVPGNRLAPVTCRLAGDDSAIDWARQELIGFYRRHQGSDQQYLEASVFELFPIGSPHEDENRRLGRWVINPDGLSWRPKAA
jgi:hypothetical protein